MPVGGELAELYIEDGRARQAARLGAEHRAELTDAIPGIGERDEGGVRLLDVDAGRDGRLALDRDAGFELVLEIGAECFARFDEIFLGVSMRRVLQAVDDAAVVGEYDQALGVLVEAADREEAARQ